MLRDLEILIKMQKKDDRIGEKEILTRTLPQELNSLKQNLEMANQKLMETKQALEENLKEQKLKELRIKENNDKINKYKDQLLAIKTNKEYKALNSEISHLENTNTDIDDEIIALMEDEVIIRSDYEEANKIQKKADEKLSLNEEKLKRKIEEVQAEIEKIRNERNKLAAEIPKNIVKRYAALIKNKDRKAVVYNINNACSGCGFKIRPQMVIEINEGNAIVSCENCGRIIVSKPPNA